MHLAAPTTLRRRTSHLTRHLMTASRQEEGCRRNERTTVSKTLAIIVSFFLVSNAVYGQAVTCRGNSKFTIEYPDGTTNETNSSHVKHLDLNSLRKNKDCNFYDSLIKCTFPQEKTSSLISDTSLDLDRRTGFIKIVTLSLRITDRGWSSASSNVFTGDCDVSNGKRKF